MVGILFNYFIDLLPSVHKVLHDDVLVVGKLVPEGTAREA